MFHVPNQYRISPEEHPYLGSTNDIGNYGAFKVPSNNRELYIIASSGEESIIKWEHVSVHIFDGKRSLTPRWDEMCKVKDLFWDEEDTVIQYHPKKSDYVNNHPNTLHLWRPTFCELPIPPTIAVGIK